MSRPVYEFFVGLFLIVRHLLFITVVGAVWSVIGIAVIVLILVIWRPQVGGSNYSGVDPVDYWESKAR